MGFEIEHGKKFGCIAISFFDAMLEVSSPEDVGCWCGHQLYDAEGKPVFAPALLRPNCAL